MLQSMRKGAGNIAAKGLMFLLVIAFASWGIGDYLTVSPNPTVATVGSVSISSADFNNEFRRDLQSIQQRTGAVISMEQARSLGLVDAALGRMIDRALVDQGARALGLRVSDQVVREAILNQPAFRGAGGQFDRLRFETALRNEGLSEGFYVNFMRANLLRAQVVESLASGVDNAPDALTDPLFRYRQEKRVIEYVVVPNAPIDTLPEPEEAEIAAFHEKNAARFSHPEFRALSFVALEPSALLNEVEASEQEMRDEYEARRAMYNIPEKRDIEQAVYATEAAAREAHALIKGGKSLDAVAEATLKVKPADLKLGKLTRDQLPAPIADRAFALNLGAVSEPVQSPLGWHIVRVAGMEAGTTRSFEQVKDELKRAVGLRHAADRLVKLKDRFEDALAASGKIEDAATSLGLTLQRIAAVDAQGRGPDGKPAAGLPAYRSFVPIAFRAAEGAEPEVHEAENASYFALRVDSVTPAKLRPLAEVRGLVIAGWKIDAAGKAAANRATAIADRVKAGAKLAELAESVKGTVEVTSPLTRAGAGGPNKLMPATLAELFGAQVGAVVTGPSRTADGHLVARLARIDAANAATGAAERAQISASIGDGIAEDLLFQYRKHLEAQFGVTLNRAALDATF
jgi:peptidyl-prolyl cis-trans isomerase D